MSYFRIDSSIFSQLFEHPKWVGDQLIEQPNVERPIF